MASTINDLYLKYVNKVGKTLENDRYFQYMFEMVQAGENELHQNNRVFHKVIDEKWLGVIEESLDAISAIIEKPRRFVTTKEEVVPVALARKISADSVRHLSMNTQFIASSEEGDIQPTRILNVSTEETYDLYENRFIYHLIQRLVTFIDKRTDIIFWQTGDETANTLSFQSKVDDAYEEITYKIEMTVKNLQSHAENDNDNMSVFMRIDRVRRLVMSLRNSSFCQIMAGCSKVRSPIQRTNLIMKDPQYRTCYKLWQFLESYDDVGYTIDIQDTAMEFDEEYLLQMYTNLITNYTVFKSLLSDKRYIESTPLQKRKKLVKPKFIKKIQEEYVDNFDREDVEIRQVFLQEVTQAQLDAEAALEEEKQARQKAQKELEDMDDQMFSLQQQVSDLMMRQQEAEIRAADEAGQKEEAQKLAKEREEANIALEAERNQLSDQLEQTKIETENQLQEMQLQMQTKLRQMQEETENRIRQMQEEAETKARLLQEEAERVLKESKEKADLMLSEAKAESERLLAEERRQKELAQQLAVTAETKAEDAVREKAAAEQAKAEAQQKENDCRIEMENALKRASDTEAQAKEAIAVIKKETDEKIQLVQRNADERIAAAQQTADESVRMVQQEADEKVRTIQIAADETVKQTKNDAQQSIRLIREEADAKVDKIKQSTDLEIQKLTLATREEIKKATDDKNAAEEAKNQMMQSVEEANEKANLAEKKAEEMSVIAEEASQRAAKAEQMSEQSRRIADEEMTKAKEAMEHAREQEEIAKKALQEKEKAEQRADANTLSHYIINALNGRRQKNDDKDE